MSRINSFAANHPVWFALGSTAAWFVLGVVFMGVASSVLAKPYGGAESGMAGRLALTSCVVLMLWRLGWLKACGIGRLGNPWVWLMAFAGLIYFACASLYSLFGSVAFDFSSLIWPPAARTAVLTQFTVGLSEEILFRGLVLYGLVRVWGKSGPGMIRSVLFTSVLLAVLHVTHVFTYGVSLPAALFLTLETLIISIWWSALVLVGGSIWPAVVLHVAGNAVVAVQSLSVPMVASGLSGHMRLLWFSVPLGALGLWLLARSRTGYAG